MMIGMSTRWIACQASWRDAGPAEDAFDHDDAAHEDADVDADRGDDRQDGVEQRVAEEDRAARQPLARAVRI